MPDILTEDDFNALKQSQDCLITYLSTPQCRVCVSLRPRIEAMAANARVPFAYIDTTKLQAVAGQLLVFAVPTMIVWVYGREFARFSRHFSTQELQGKLERARELVDTP